MKLSDNAIKVLNSRYLLKDTAGNIIEAPEELFKRVAEYVATAEIKWGAKELADKYSGKFYELMASLKFLPNSPTLMNAGTNQNQLSACFVLPVEDSMDGIFTTLKNMALIQQSGGGTGFNFSKLRPKGESVSSHSGSATGPVGFMKVFDAATQNIRQGGKRRGANMGVLNIDHPDIKDFISLKSKEGILSNFNISVAVTDSFMNAVEKDALWKLKKPGTEIVTDTIKAKELWQNLVEMAWQGGDPGLIFTDTINRYNPTPAIGSINCTNPCGEVPLLPYEACNLGSINVSLFSSGSGQIDWKELEETVELATRFLDNVIEVNSFIIPEIELMVKGNRKIGLGIMGWAELLIKLNIPYDSDQALELGRELMKFVNEKSKNSSVALAKERGVFKNWEKSIYYPHTPIRNATRTSIAPTGTISIIANTSSSIEPLFALAIKRQNVLDGETLEEMNPVFIKYLQSCNLYSEKLVVGTAQTGNLVKSNLPDSIKALFKTALEISPEWHLKHQIAFQEHTDNAVSKTINLPYEAKIEDVNNAYLYAWKNGAKGITVFRSGSRQKQVLNTGINNIGACKVCID